MKFCLNQFRIKTTHRILDTLVYWRLSREFLATKSNICCRKLQHKVKFATDGWILINPLSSVSPKFGPDTVSKLKPTKEVMEIDMAYLSKYPYKSVYSTFQDSMQSTIALAIFQQKKYRIRAGWKLQRKYNNT